MYEGERWGSRGVLEALYRDGVIAGCKMKSLFTPFAFSVYLSLISFFISLCPSLSLCVSNFSVLMRGDIMNADAVRDALKGKVTRTLAHKRTRTLVLSVNKMNKNSFFTEVGCTAKVLYDDVSNFVSLK